MGTVYDVCVFVSFCDGWRGHLATIYCMLFESTLCSLSLYSIVTHPDDKNGAYFFSGYISTSLNVTENILPTLVLSSGEDVLWVQDIKALHM